MKDGKNIKIIYSSITGNTKKVAEKAYEYLKSKEEALKALGYCGLDLLNANNYEITGENEDLFILCFWCRRSTMDDLTMGILETLKSKDIIAIGTLTGDANGEYGDRVKNKVESAIEEKNNAVGVHLCQGHSDLKRIAPRRNLEPGMPKYISPEKWEHHLRLQGRPDAKDIDNMTEFLNRKLLMQTLTIQTAVRKK